MNRETFVKQLSKALGPDALVLDRLPGFYHRNGKTVMTPEFEVIDGFIINEADVPSVDRKIPQSENIACLLRYRDGLFEFVAKNSMTPQLTIVTVRKSKRYVEGWRVTMWVVSKQN